VYILSLLLAIYFNTTATRTACTVCYMLGVGFFDVSALRNIVLPSFKGFECANDVD
jgi:hypothetical protein